MKDLKSTLNEIFRYLYGGIFFYFSAQIFHIKILENILKDIRLPFSTNPTIPILFLFCLGALMYILFRAICTPLMDNIHIWLHRDCFGFRDRCMLRFVREHINSKNSHDVVNVYRAIRDNLNYYDEAKRKELHLQRSEVHLLYVSGFILIILTVIKYIGLHHLEPLGFIATLSKMFYIILNTAEFVEILFLSISFFAAGMTLDMYICEQERVQIRIKEKGVIEFMNSFFPNSEIKKTKDLLGIIKIPILYLIKRLKK